MLPSTPGTLPTYLNSGAPFRPVNLLTITLQSGVVLRYTDHDVDLPVAWLGGTFSHALVFKRSDITRQIGVQVDVLTIDVMPADTDLIGSTPWLVGAQAGALDFADVQLDVGIIDLASSALQGTFTWFVGSVATLGDISAASVKLNAKSFTARLDVQMPRNLVQPGCLNTLFSPPCGLVETAWRSTGTISAVASDQCSFSTGLAQAAGYFDGGRLTITSGPNANVVRRIKGFAAGGGVTLFAPLVWPLTVGTTFAVSPGCPKTASVCASRFSNLVNFRGLPYVPTPETVTG